MSTKRYNTGHLSEQARVCLHSNLLLPAGLDRTRAFKSSMYVCIYASLSKPHKKSNDTQTKIQMQYQVLLYIFMLQYQMLRYIPCSIFIAFLPLKLDTLISHSQHCLVQIYCTVCLDGLFEASLSICKLYCNAPSYLTLRLRVTSLGVGDF